MRIYIYYKERYHIQKKEEKTHFDIEMVANSYFQIKKETLDTEFKNAKKEEILEVYKKSIKKESLIHVIRTDDRAIVKNTEKEIIEVELVLAKKSNFVKGQYYAHEYDKYAEGKARKIEYSNGFTEYEVKCLDENLRVADGIWEEVSNNGCGDRFYPYQEVK